MKVSIIIPVYKAELFLRKCIESIIEQTYTDWELLLIDDGSPDMSGSICNEYAQKDYRIKVYHKTNGGVSSARNLGLEKMTGDWVTFVDADDWIARDTIASCSYYFKKYDVIRFSMRMIYHEHIEQKNKNFILPKSDDKEKIINRTLARNSLMCVWGGFYRSDLFRKYNIKFSPSLVMAEDWLVIMQILIKASSAIEISEVYYYYNQQNATSCSNNPTCSKVENCFQALVKIKNILGVSIEKHSKAISECECILWKAMLRSVISQYHLKGIAELVRMKKKYDFPSIGSILKADVSVITKVICFLCYIL